MEFGVDFPTHNDKGFRLATSRPFWGSLPELCLELQRIRCIVPHPFHFRSSKRPVLETIDFKNLIVTKVESSLHLGQTSLYRIITSLWTWFASNKVSYKRPSMVSQAWVMFLHHFLVLINQDGPVTMQIVWVLQKHFVCPLFCLCNQKVDKCRLIISFKVRSSFQSLWEQFTCSKKCQQIMLEKQGAAKMSLCHHHSKPSHWQVFKGDDLQLAYEPNTNLHGLCHPQ